MSNSKRSYGIKIKPTELDSLINELERVKANLMKYKEYNSCYYILYLCIIINEEFKRYLIQPSSTNEFKDYATKYSANSDVWWMRHSKQDREEHCKQGKEIMQIKIDYITALINYYKTNNNG